MVRSLCFLGNICSQDVFVLEVSIFDFLSELFQLSLPRSQPPWRRRSRRSGGAAAIKTWTQPLSLSYLTFSILPGEEWKASWMMKWPSGLLLRSWSPGICWPGATTTSTISAWGWLSYGGWACWSAMVSCCLSGISCTLKSHRQKHSCCFWNTKNMDTHNTLAPPVQLGTGITLTQMLMLA